MGQAKARGTFDQRKAEAVEREAALAVKRTEEHRALMARQAKERAERIAKMPPEQRKVAIMDASPKHTALMLMAALAASNAGALPILTVDDATKRKYRRG